MKKYKFTDNEKELLKVAKLNQKLSSNLQNDIAKLNQNANRINNENEIFLKEVENKLGINKDINLNENISYKRESTHVDEYDWPELVEQAEKIYGEDINFDDLLRPEDIENVQDYFKQIDNEFCKKTGLNKNDIVFLFVAIALQCVRQYVLDPMLKNQRHNASSNDEKGRKNNATSGWYYVETDKILTNAVPFDAIKYGGNDSVKGFLKGYKNHRFATLGHDPILGWFFGTANIMTATVTNSMFESAHVKYIPGKGNVIHSRADNKRILSSIQSRITLEGMDGWMALVFALAREGIHLKSDVGTKMSLSITGISQLSPDFANKLSTYGIDVASIGTEISLSCLINYIISVMHGLCFDENNDDKSLYKVRTRKILLYSNLIASTSNIIISQLTNKKELLDVGGILVTISRLFKDVSFILKIKEEFVQKHIDAHFEGVKSEIQELYDNRFFKL